MDYQQIIDMVAECIKIAMPIGVVFGLSEKVINLFLSLAFGKEKVRL